MVFHKVSFVFEFGMIYKCFPDLNENINNITLYFISVRNQIMLTIRKRLTVEIFSYTLEIHVFRLINLKYRS